MEDIQREGNQIPPELSNNDTKTKQDDNRKWSDMETRQLITLYEQHEILWNVTLTDYRNRVNKMEAYHGIASKLNIDTKEVQRKLHNLQSQFNSEVNKLKKKSSGQSTDEVYVHNWPYFSALNSIQVKLPTTSSTLTMKAKQSNNVSTEGDGSEDESIDESSTSIADIQEEVQADENPHQARKKLKLSQEMPLYVQQAMSQLNQKNDEEQVFGDFCASELRQIKNPASKRIFKRIVMEAITNIGEDDALGTVYNRDVPLNFICQPPSLQASPSPHLSEGSSSSSAQFQQMQPPDTQQTQQTGQQEQLGQQSSLLQLSRSCLALYERGVKSLNTPRMWEFYIDTLSDINKDKNILPNYKKRVLIAALQKGNASGKLSEKHYLLWVGQLQDGDKHKRLVEVLQGAVKRLPESATLWQLLLRAHLTRGEDKAAAQAFDAGAKALGRHSLPLWKLMLQFEQTKRNNKVEEIFKKSWSECAEISGPLRPMYLEWLVLTQGIAVARKTYDVMCELHPPSLDIHRKMIYLESIQPTLKKTRIRQCHTMACAQFGATNVDVWIDHCKFEFDNGANEKDIKKICNRAKTYLAPPLRDVFISEFNIFQNIPKGSDKAD